MSPLPPIVSAEWLYQHLDHPHLVLVDCRFSLQQPTLGQMQYEAGHLPNAYYLDLNHDLSAPVQVHGGRHPLPDPQQLSRRLGRMGLTNTGSQPESWVVAYDDSRFAFAARFWWLLQYYGFEQVAVLDGGFQGWQALGYPVTAAVPPDRNGEFIPQIHTDWVVDINTVRQAQEQPNVVLVDSREPSRYRGDEEPIDPIAGHIPGAVNLPWQEVTTSDGKAYAEADQQTRWQSIPRAEETIVYCGSGVTACVNLLSRAIAGLPAAKLYAGSWSDWCSYETSKLRDTNC